VTGHLRWGKLLLCSVVSSYKWLRFAVWLFLNKYGWKLLPWVLQNIALQDPASLKGEKFTNWWHVVSLKSKKCKWYRCEWYLIVVLKAWEGMSSVSVIFVKKRKNNVGKPGMSLLMQRKFSVSWLLRLTAFVSTISTLLKHSLCM
jgi:hypothetical protein